MNSTAASGAAGDRRRGERAAEATLDLGAETAPHRVIVFPHAGAGTAAYVRLARAFVERGLAVSIVRYPGRETRLLETPADSVGALVAVLAAELAPRVTGACSFFGHSLGALVAFELAHAWRTAGPTPVRLWLSGRRPPQVPADLPHLHPLSGAEFLQAVAARYEALPPALLRSPELVELTLPVLRADFCCSETYCSPGRLPLDTPITILRGAADRWLDASAVAGWSPHTTGPVDERVFPGGHFFLDTALDQVASLVAASIARAVR